MKVQLLLPLAAAVSVITVGLMQMRKKDSAKEERRNRFQEIKLRVTYDVLREYQNDKTAKQHELETAETDSKTLEGEVNQLQSKADVAKGESDTCLTSKTSEKDVLNLVEKELSDVKASTEKERINWLTESETLQKQLADRSAVCNFLKPEAEAARKLCGGEAKPEEAKAEAPKPEEAKAEAPKPEEAKAEAPKPEEAKAEAPKPEEAKAEAPKAEAPKAEAPKEEAKPEEAKAEAPKPEEAKAEAPKAEVPKPEEAKAEAPKPEEAKAEAPKVEAKAEEPKPEEAKAEAPKVEAKAEAPKKR
ncbi:neurofilament heavy polypeptide-like isoform X2 [Notolabrus celidotus]|uniref:neurofilament heavy polypeptide-like isoform X2 n=1 Tax=Notolabrus celidotus TaxID=1203425 RepID=UPI00148FD0FF|nr:neurofilament heavy polypeptide-like isoform X2 [Notolabrus celidotus]